MQLAALLLRSKILLFLGLGTLALGIFIWFDTTPITFQSEESKNITGGPVYNQIQWREEKTRDIWIMRQSHIGNTQPVHEWDNLAIVIEKTKPQKEAVFYQIAPSEEGWSDKAKPIAYKAACFLCHSNGLRVIRPIADSSSFPLSIKNRVRLFLWNLKIKSYGRVISKGVEGATHFRYAGKIANAPLEVPECIRCHKDSGFFARGTLTRQNFMSIRFMVEKGYMPPLHLPLSQQSKNAIFQFTNGQ